MTAPVRIANAERIALEALADVLEPPPPVDLERWAVDNIVFADGASDFPGPYNRRVFPFYSDLFEALSPEDPCRYVTLRGAAQSGKTILEVIFVLCHFDLDPGGEMGVVNPTESNASAWSRSKLWPLVVANPRLRALFCATGKEGGNTIGYKERADGRGRMRIVGANSASDLSQHTWRRIVMDDLAKWTLNTAGDPERQAESRTQGVEFAKVFRCSTAFLEDDCRITKSFLAGSQEHYHVPCPHCGTLQTLDWEVMRDALDETRPDDVHFVCRACGALIEEKHRAWMLDPANGARWIARRPERARHHRSFHLWAAYSPLTSWQRIAQAWFAAKGHPSEEQVFLNDTAALPYRGDSDAPDIEALKERAKEGHARGTIPAGFPLMFCGVDVQEDRVEWHVVGYGPRGRRAPVEYGVIPYPITDPRCGERLDSLLKATWPNAAGRRLGIDRLAIDGNYDTPNVLAWARRHPLQRVMMVRGVAGQRDMVLMRVAERSDRTGKARRYGGRFYHVAVDALKLTLYRALKLTEPDADWFIALPAGMPDEYFEQLVGERRQLVQHRNGGTRMDWVPVGDRRHEVLDTMNYSEAAARKHGLWSLTDADWERLSVERESPPAAGQLDLEEPVPARDRPGPATAPPFGRPAGSAAPVSPDGGDGSAPSPAPRAPARRRGKIGGMR